MKLNFRQGIVRFQTDLSNNPTFLQVTPSGVTLNVSPDPTILNFAQGTSDYLFIENVTVPNAWPGALNPAIDEWLYWDIDIISGIRTFGRTQLEPIVSSVQPPKIFDRHWYDTTTDKMRVCTGVRYVNKLRIFAAKVDNGVVVPYLLGSQVGDNSTVNSGAILYDEDDNAVKKFDRFGRGHFITTEHKLSSQFSRLVNFVLEGLNQDAVALEHIPPFYAVAYKGVNQIGLASNTSPDFPVAGISSEEMFTGEARSFIIQGYMKNELWDWTEPPGTKIFVGETGELTTAVPQATSLQCIATIVSPKTILVNIQHNIRL